MSENPWYSFYIGDYDKKTSHLSMLEHGAYLLLLNHYYAMRQPLPADLKTLYRICRATTPNERRAVQEILSKYFILRDAQHINKRCDREIEKLLKFINRQSAAAYAKAQPRHCHGSAEPQSQSISKKESKGTRFALALLPDDWKQECKRLRPELDPNNTFAQFHDYWIAVPGIKGLKTDWLATWRNWVRSQKATIGSNLPIQKQIKLPTQKEI